MTTTATTFKIFAPDTTDGIELLLGPSTAPHDLTGIQGAVIVTRNMNTGDRVSAAATVRGLATAGRVGRAWQSGERPAAGAHFAVECIVTFGDGTVRTYPGLGETGLVADVAPRRTDA